MNYQKFDQNKFLKVNLDSSETEKRYLDTIQNDLSPLNEKGLFKRSVKIKSQFQQDKSISENIQIGGKQINQLANIYQRTPKDLQNQNFSKSQLIRNQNVFKKEQEHDQFENQKTEDTKRYEKIIEIDFNEKEQPFQRRLKQQYLEKYRNLLNIKAQVKVSATQGHSNLNQMCLKDIDAFANLSTNLSQNRKLRATSYQQQQFYRPGERVKTQMTNEDSLSNLSFDQLDHSNIFSTQILRDMENMAAKSHFPMKYISNQEVYVQGKQENKLYEFRSIQLQKNKQKLQKMSEEDYEGNQQVPLSDINRREKIIKQQISSNYNKNQGMFDTKKYRNNYLKNTELYLTHYQEKNTKRTKNSKTQHNFSFYQPNSSNLSIYNQQFLTQNSVIITLPDESTIKEKQYRKLTSQNKFKIDKPLTSQNSSKYKDQYTENNQFLNSNNQEFYQIDSLE